MRVAIAFAGLGLLGAACSGGHPEGTTTGGTTSGATTAGSTTGSGTNGTTGGTTGGCDTCRTGETCVAGQCQCDPTTCTDGLACSVTGRCIFDACRIMGVQNDNSVCIASSDCGCPLYCQKQADGGQIGICRRRCNTTADCPIPDTSCQSGVCQVNLCGGDGGNGVLNGPCDALGTGDGTCVPHSLGLNTGPNGVSGHCVQNGCATQSCRLDAHRTDGYALCAPGFACVGQAPYPGNCYQLCNIDADAGAGCEDPQLCKTVPGADPRLNACLPSTYHDAGPACVAPPPTEDGGNTDPGWHEPFPLMPLNPGGVVLNALELTTIDYAGYELDQEIQDYAAWIVGSTWLATVGHSYGVGNGTYAQHYVIHSPPPSSIADTEIETLIESLLGVDGGLPAPNANSVYFIYFPQGTNITGAGGVACQDYGGYHSEDVAGTYDIPYAVIPTCSANFIDVAVSHELIEAATDPLVGSRPGYRFADPSNAFTYLSEGEVGDMCQGYIGTYDGTYTAQRIWSNDEASA